jgi:hypothetical protein
LAAISGDAPAGLVALKRYAGGGVNESTKRSESKLQPSRAAEPTTISEVLTPSEIEELRRNASAAMATARAEFARLKKMESDLCPGELPDAGKG